MFDFPFQEASVWTGLYCIIFYIILLFSNYKNSLNTNTISSNNSSKGFVIFLIGFFIVTHCSEGDFFNMQIGVYDYWEMKGHTYDIVKEEIYSKIALFVQGNYFLFRIIVWGGAFVLFCLTAKRMRVSVYHAAVLLIITHSLIFSYARCTLAMAIYFFGLSFLCRPFKFKLLSYALGILLIFYSLEFHTSAIFMAIMTFMIFLPINRWSLILILILIPFVSFILKDYFYLIMSSDMIDEVVAEKMQTYVEREKIQGIAAKIISFFEYMSFYIPFLLTSITLFSKRMYKKCSKEIFLFYKLTIGLVLSTIAFMFMGDMFYTFQYRVLFMSMIPLTIIVTKLYQSQLMTRKYFKWCVYSGIIFLMSKYMYIIYYIIV